MAYFLSMKDYNGDLEDLANIKEFLRNLKAINTISG